MKISSIGKGLSILICCDFTVPHDWMSFLTFWSVKKNLLSVKKNFSSVKKKLFVSQEIFLISEKKNLSVKKYLW